ncbi:hypothetical protein AGMMS49574_18800 [Bacteroidia bacterium]|nr:hypothetical protein AGMMS49574_18800 [Bacteroidia bacterium]
MFILSHWFSGVKVPASINFTYICFMKQTVKVVIGFLLLVLVYSCANIGMPNGGPYDENPPKFISSTPNPNQLRYKGKTVEILFDELIQLDKPSENVIITPPQRQLPVVRALGRRAVVELKDSIRENTTYTIDFTNAISDNNEKNVLENFTFAFSTGDVIDTLEVSGYLINAENLEPMPGITVGLHNNLDDSAFVKTPFLRTSRTNDRGKFVIRNIAPGSYHIFALDDQNRDYKFDQLGEGIAFSDSLIVPTFEFTSRQDTLWVDSLTIDTIKTVGYTRFMPDDIVLRFFQEKFVRQYALRPERSQTNRFTLHYNAPLDTFINPVPLNFEPADSSWFITQWADDKASIHYWLTDSTVWKQDTLRMEITYPASDSLNVLRPKTDTIALTVRVTRDAPEARKKKKDDDEPDPIVFLGMNIKPARDVFDTISVVFDEPVMELNKDWFLLEMQIDTLWESAEFDFFPDSIDALKFYINRKWKYGEKYRIAVDSAAIYSVYGKWNNYVSEQFGITQEDQYGHLWITIQGVDTLPAFVDLLNGADAVVRTVRVKDGGALFMDLSPNKYYARLVMDTNDNFIWDTGNYADKQQPEEVFYYPKVIEIMKNWQVEIQDPWIIQALPIYRQKPLDITKNKPKEVTKQKRDYKNDGRNRSSGNSNPMGRGMGF